MYFIKIVFLLLLSLQLYALELQRNYYVESDHVYIHDIIQNTQSDIELFSIDRRRHSKRIKSKELIALLKSYGYNNISSKYPYIQFNKKSPINTKQIENKIREYYEKKYKNITIYSIDVEPNSYLKSLPQEYRLNFPKRAYLSKHSLFNIKTYENRKIFFNYLIKAKVDVLLAKVEIKKGSELSNINLKKKSIMLDKFKAMPLQSITRAKYQSKHKIKKDSIVTKRDIVGLELVKRGATVSVTLHEPNITITLLAKALKSGRFGEHIYVIQKNGKKIEVEITGKNQAEVK